MTRASRFLPVHVGPLVRGRDGVDGREMEFIVRSLVELKLQVEELRRRTEPASGGRGSGVIMGSAPCRRSGGPSPLPSGQPQSALAPGGASVASERMLAADSGEGIEAPGHRRRPMW